MKKREKRLDDPENNMKEYIFVFDEDSGQLLVCYHKTFKGHRKPEHKVKSEHFTDYVKKFIQDNYPEALSDAS